MELRNIPQAMQAIAAPLVTRLTASLQSESSSATDVAILLEQYCALLRGVSPTANQWCDADLTALGGHPCVLMLQSSWEVLDHIFVRHSTSSNAMEKLCRCYKHTARNCGDWFRVLVPKLVPQV